MLRLEQVLEVLQVVEVERVLQAEAAEVLATLLVAVQLVLAVRAAPALNGIQVTGLVAEEAVVAVPTTQGERKHQLEVMAVDMVLQEEEAVPAQV